MANQIKLFITRQMQRKFVNLVRQVFYLVVLKVSRP